MTQMPNFIETLSINDTGTTWQVQPLTDTGTYTMF